MNEASTIIQSAAHEDANIIFGAVLDEKMKDEVKITVIATGFRSDNPQRRERAVSAAAAAISQARTASAYIAPRPEVRAADPPPQVHVEAAKPPAAPPPITPRPAAPQRETTSLADVKSTVKTNYEEDDLDVPAFIRKRNESS